MTANLSGSDDPGLAAVARLQGLRWLLEQHRVDHPAPAMPVAPHVEVEPPTFEEMWAAVERRGRRRRS